MLATVGCELEKHGTTIPVAERFCMLMHCLCWRLLYYVWLLVNLQSYESCDMVFSVKVQHE